jgi:general secretion pathway protein J
MRRTPAQGFTLIELLVAIAIFAIIAALAYGGLNGVIHQRDDTLEAMKQLRTMQLAMTIIGRDFSQLEPRTVRDGMQGPPQPALSGGTQNIPQVIFTRGGWSNPLAEVRSTQQRVAYELDNGKLLRLSWPELDQGSQTQPLKQTLLEHVTDFSLRYMDANGQWQEQWPPLNTNANAFLARLPLAVEVRFTVKDQGEFTRLIEAHRNDDGS